MNRIATLGPAGTFSELAAKKYIETFDKSAEITFYSTITKVFNGISKECELGIIPIENTLDGYVQLTLDLLSQTDFNIIYETVVPIQFSIVSNTLGISDIKKIYVQFKTQGQCYNFLEQVTNAKVITTESNGESFQKVERGILGQAAIIPRHMLKASNKFSFNIENVTDSEENDTRFIVLSKDTIKYDINRRYKTSIIVMDAADNKPGALSKILNEFSEKNINLTSIMSRPTKKALGKYYFFIDIDGHYPEEKSVKEVIDKISKNNIVKVLGSYSLV
ncbi:ACT domain-containing protein [Clostridium autoethanogenum]|uniref:Prephenate dehydratase n=1 Tax=Clostridium autoethanogenum TaxID=84023 RepID=A0A3M0S9F5_9CLOT|nr:prephenate dehydratase domain-containing protein [Clostridium autoethanogenum]RMC95093.1 ACT domain-containing protein [Clostridium autoethanogenum]